RLRAVPGRARQQDLEHARADLVTTGAGASDARERLGPARAEWLRPGEEGPCRRRRPARPHSEQRRPGRPARQRDLPTAGLPTRRPLSGDLPPAWSSGLALGLLRKPPTRDCRGWLDLVTSCGAVRGSDADRWARDRQAQR